MLAFGKSRILLAIIFFDKASRLGIFQGINSLKFDALPLKYIKIYFVSIVDELILVKVTVRLHVLILV